MTVEANPIEDDISIWRLCRHIRLSFFTQTNDRKFTVCQVAKKSKPFRQATCPEREHALRAYFLPRAPTRGLTLWLLLPSSNRCKIQMVTDQDNLFLWQMNFLLFRKPSLFHLSNCFLLLAFFSGLCFLLFAWNTNLPSQKHGCLIPYIDNLLIWSPYIGQMKIQKLWTKSEKDVMVSMQRSLRRSHNVMSK